MTPAPVQSIRTVILAAAFLALPLLSSAAVTVPGDYSTIQAAINAVLNGSQPDGTTINVQPGTFPEALIVSPSGKSFTVRGVAGAGSTIVDAFGRGAPALTVDRATGHVVFQGLTFRRGAPGVAAGGGFVITGSSPAFVDSIFEANTASGGAGGAMFNSSSPTFTGCIIRNNSARGSGGGVLIYSGSRPVFTNSEIVGNVSGTTAYDGVGGGIDSRDSSPTFRGSRISGNSAKFAGGAIYQGGTFGSGYGTSMLVLEDSEVADNIASPFSSAYNPGEGGGIHIEDNTIATLTRVRILRNRANTGGGLNAFRARYDVVDSIIDGNQAMARSDGGVPGGIGGGINAMSQNPAPSTGPVSTVNLIGTLVRNNVGVTGGGVVVTGDANLQATLTLTSSVVDKNTAQNQGGGILVSHAALTASNSMIIRNNVSVSDPAAGGQVGGGIDITTFSSANISGTTISHNTAGTFGGGIFVLGGSNTLNMTASHVYENTVLSGRGGGLFIAGASQSGTIQTSIIADNQGGSAQINEEGCTSVVYQNNTITATKFSGCTVGGRETGTASSPVRFAKFLAVPRAGTSMTLAWSVARALSVTVGGVGTWNSPNNSPTGTVDVTPGSSTTYNLTATASGPNGGNYSAVPAGVTYVPPPASAPPPPTGTAVAGDFDRDGKTEVTIYRPSTGMWYMLTSGSGFAAGAGYDWGVSTDLPVPGDYDGDNKADVAVYRPSSGHWFIQKSSTNFTTSATYQWGTPGDRAVPGDYDGDGKTDPAIYRPSNGTWYILKSSTNFTTSLGYVWGVNTDLPMPGDYDGDSRTDIAVYRPSSGHWFILKSSTNFTTSATYQWGTSGDVPVLGDFDGDGKRDPAVFRPSNGTWYLLKSSTNYSVGAGYQWGVSTDMPVLGDYDGDGKTDIVVYRASTGHWFILKSSTNFTTNATYQWGTSGDMPALKRQ